jgi:hypothetical protein
MSTQNLYNPEVVQLVGGLDYVTPRPSAPPGCLVDCYNFEVADILGYKRGDGCEPFDGHPSISSVYSGLYIFSVSDSTGANTNQAVRLSTDTAANPFGFITSVPDSTDIVVCVTDLARFYSIYNFLANNPGGLYLILSDGGFSFVVTAVKALSKNSATITAAITSILTAYNTAYSRVQIASTQMAENNAVAYTPSMGLHWFKDQLYSVVDCHSFVFDTGVSQVYPNDILKNAGFGIDILVRDVQLISGSWSGGNAVGKILYTKTFGDSYYPQTATSTGLNTAIFGLVTDSTALDIIRGSAIIASALKFRKTVSGTVPPTWAAEMYRTMTIPTSISTTYAGCGWQNIDHGYFFSYDASNSTLLAAPNTAGRNASPNPAVSSSTSSLVTAGAGVAVVSPGSLVFTGTPTGTSWNYNAGTNGSPQLNIATQNDNLRIQCTGMTSVGDSAVLQLSRFSFSNIPADALITGIEIDGGAWNNTAGTSKIAVKAVCYIPTQLNTPSTKISPQITSTSGVASTSFTLGGNSETWNCDLLTPSQINNLVVYLSATCTAAGTTNSAFNLDYISVKVYYQTSSSIYYFWNGTDDVQGIITTTHIDTGTFAAATAVGIMHVAQVTPYSTAARSQIGANDVIRTLPAGAGLIVAKVTNNMSFAGLPSLSQIQAQNSRYELIDANFYGNKDWSAIYGVSGAGKAFVYDSFYFRYVYTGLSDVLDIPRHIAFHNFHLCLGYQVGALLTSVTGSPEDFSGVNGAAEFDTGDAITGLLRMNGTTLAIFCQDSIHALNGTDNINFSMSVLSPYEGAIEYTVVNCGKPVYASYRGISTLDQTNAYGNFLGNRLSTNITPWLAPRLTKRIKALSIDTTSTPTSIYSGGGTQYPLFAQPIRTKNQYRLWFSDGTFLTMTLMGANQDPVFTKGQINLTHGAQDFLIPLAYSSDVDSTGLERNHVSYYNPFSGRASEAFGSGSINKATNNYVYELERGWGFGKCPVQAYFTTTHNFYDNPFQIDRMNKVRLHGQSYGASTLSMDVSADYLSNDFKFGDLHGQTASNAPSQDISLPRNGFNNSPTTLSSDFQPLTNIANVSKSGRSFAFQFYTDPSTIEPPSVCQELLIQIKEDKGDV